MSASTARHRHLENKSNPIDSVRVTEFEFKLKSPFGEKNQVSIVA